MNVLSDLERRVGVLTQNLHPHVLQLGGSVWVPGMSHTAETARARRHCGSGTFQLLVTFHLHKPGRERMSPQNTEEKFVPVEPIG